MVYNIKYDLAYRLISDILSQQEILLSINSGGGSIAEARIEKGLPFRIQDNWATIGDEGRPWHIHLNMDEVTEARFVKEVRSSDGRQSRSIQFFNTKGELLMRANFTKLYDSEGKLVKKKVAKFDEMHIKYRRMKSLSFRTQKFYRLLSKKAFPTHL
jgi:putative heme iron utilization protein